MENEKMIYSAILDVMAKVSAIAKNRNNSQQGFKFRGVDDVMNELHPILSDCGLFVVPVVKNETREERKTAKGNAMYATRLYVDFNFFAKDGSSVTASVIGEAMDSGDKASNKALSIAYKYALLQTFCIPTEDDKDPDAVTPPETVVIGNPPKAPISDKPAQVQAVEKVFEGKTVKEEKTDSGDFDLF